MLHRHQKAARSLALRHRITFLTPGTNLYFPREYGVLGKAQDASCPGRPLLQARGNASTAAGRTASLRQPDPQSAQHHAAQLKLRGLKDVLSWIKDCCSLWLFLCHLLRWPSNPLLLGALHHAGRVRSSISNAVPHLPPKVPFP